MNLDLDDEERIYLIALLLKDKQRHITEDLFEKLNVQDHEYKTARGYLKDTKTVTHADFLKIAVALAGCMGIVVCIGFISFAYLAKDYWLGVLWLLIMTVCFIVTVIGRRAVDLMETTS